MRKKRQKKKGPVIDKSVLTFGVRKRVRDRDYLDAVHDEECWICGATPCDPAHITTGQEGGWGMKPDDDLVIPLCHTHHMEQEANPGPGWWVENVLKPMARKLYSNLSKGKN